MCVEVIPELFCEKFISNKKLRKNYSILVMR